MDSYKILVNGVEAATISANFAQASCAIELNGKATPYQVADAKHDPDNAAELVNKWCFSEGGEIWGDDDQVEVVECN